MSQQIKSHVTPEEYLRLERQSEYKSEYVNDEVFAQGFAGQSLTFLSP